LYGSNRGHNSIAAYEIDQSSGKSNHIGNESTGGQTPRNFGVDPTGTFLLAANQDSDTVFSFQIDQQSGRPVPTGHIAEVPSPACVRFLASTVMSSPNFSPGLPLGGVTTSGIETCGVAFDARPVTLREPARWAVKLVRNAG